MYGTIGTVNGRDNVAAMIGTFIAALPDLKATEQVLVAEGDYVFVWGVVEGTHRGDFFGVPPTGGKLHFETPHLYRINRQQDREGMGRRRRARDPGRAWRAPRAGLPRGGHSARARPVNLARLVFLDRRSTEFYGDWDRIAHDAVGSLRAEAGRNPHDKALTGLVGELATRSHEFRVRWGGHDVRYYRSGTQPFHHPLAGNLTLDYDALEIPADPGQTIVAYSAPAGSAARIALDQLASWTTAPNDTAAITPDQPG